MRVLQNVKIKKTPSRGLRMNEKETMNKPSGINYSALVPPDMTEEIFWEDGLLPKDERLWVPLGSGR